MRLTRQVGGTSCHIGKERPGTCTPQLRNSTYGEGKECKGDKRRKTESVCAILHISKIFEVGISGSLLEELKYLHLDIVEQAGFLISVDLAYVCELVIGVIDVDRSKEKGYETIIKEGFCDELDELRQIYEGLPEFLEEVSALELARLPCMYGDKAVPSIIYIHQIGLFTLSCFIVIIALKLHR
ncbi:MutS protein msh5 [Datura stramonium]|uniref:MutS protein msh5 n=1 Tax=Datura stramonium TaxID=4076 RepID=A0ABS8T4L2_DATST|nr:MutS protein msh5 [Datura stramonium]